MNLSQIGFISNIKKETLENNNFRKVLFTGSKMQLVLMYLKPGEEIGLETHEGHDQFLRIEEGEAKIILNDEVILAEDDFAIVVPAGIKHNVINTSTEKPLKLYTIYAPPEHEDGIVQKEKPSSN